MIEWLHAIDISAFHLINRDWVSSFSDAFFPAITDLHKSPWFPWILLPGLWAAFFIFRRSAWGVTYLFLILAAAISDAFAGQVIKKLVQRPRPFDQLEDVIQRCPAAGYSFVSNHAMNMFTICTFLGLEFPKARWPLFFLAFLVSYSRVYCGVHFPLDILAAGTLGLGFGFLAHYGLSRYKEGPWPKF